MNENEIKLIKETDEQLIGLIVEDIIYCFIDETIENLDHCLIDKDDDIYSYLFALITQYSHIVYYWLYDSQHGYFHDRERVEFVKRVIRDTVAKIERKRGRRIPKVKTRPSRHITKKTS